MRAFLVFFLSSLIASGAAAPLSNKEIALMLRAGYSSDSVLSEVANRRVLDVPDEATKKTMLQFGATAQLISALESGAYTISAPEADRAKQQLAAAAARQAAQIEEDRKLNTLYQAQQAEARAKAASRPPAGKPIVEALKEKLVRCRDGSISPVDGLGLENKKLVAFYYSAHWCAPCRKFTPELVSYYNRIAPAHPEFELIFISSDHSRFGWETYMRETKMPWLAIDYDQLNSVAALRQLGGAGIPSLLAVDARGQVVASSYEGDQYVGPQKALTELDQIFAAKANPPVAQAR